MVHIAVVMCSYSDTLLLPCIHCGYVFVPGHAIPNGVHHKVVFVPLRVIVWHHKNPVVSKLYFKGVWCRETEPKHGWESRGWVTH